MSKIVIRAGQSDKLYWQDVWKYHELFYFLAMRDLSVRYKQTIIGILWAVIRPVLTVIVFTFIFSRIAKLSPEGAAPYPIMVFAALISWQFFATSISSMSSSVIDNKALISKIYFPRIIIPLSSVVAALVESLISVVVLFVFMVYYQYLPGYHVIYFPIFLIFAGLAAIGPGLLLAALNVKYRDFTYIVPFLLQIGIYISPIGFSSSIVPEKFRLIYSLNPMVGVIDGFRWSINGGSTELYLPGLISSCIISILFLILGIYVFRRTEKTFVDNM